MRLNRLMKTISEIDRISGSGNKVQDNPNCGENRQLSPGMGFFKQAGRIMQQSVEENQRAWSDLELLLDKEMIK